jgi:choline dehydrogenase
LLLLEAGGSDLYLYCINPRTDWMMKTDPDPGLNGRSLV